MSCKDDTILICLETAMKFVNQYSFVLMAAVALLVLGIFTLRGGLKLQYLIALGALSLGIVLAYRFLNPGGTFLFYTWLPEDTKKANGYPSQEVITRPFAQHFELTSIEHGTYRQRISAWFTFQRKD